MKYWGPSTSVHFPVDMAHTCIIVVIVIDTNTLTESHRIDYPDNSCTAKLYVEYIIDCLHALGTCLNNSCTHGRWVC